VGGNATTRGRALVRRPVSRDPTKFPQRRVSILSRR
jgi:hypothetical protein